MRRARISIDSLMCFEMEPHQGSRDHHSRQRAHAGHAIQRSVAELLGHTMLQEDASQSKADMQHQAECPVHIVGNQAG